jgi:hypothetical protein
MKISENEPVLNAFFQPQRPDLVVNMRPRKTFSNLYTGRSQLYQIYATLWGPGFEVRSLDGMWPGK